MTTPGVRWRRRSAVALAALFAIGASAAVAAPAARASAAISSQATAPPPAASAAAIQAALGVNGSVPAEFVFLVDLSGSMGADGTYQTVVNDLSNYLGYLAAHEPQDHVDVITFWRKGTANHLYGGPPQAEVGLPTEPENGSTDFGPAFDLALTSLGRAPSDTRFGAVLLLSDGVLHAAGDTNYETYQSPGWPLLANRAGQLRYPVNGYAVPLNNSHDVVTNQDQAFEAVFTKQQPKTFPANPNNLGQQLAAIDSDVLNSEVTSAANKESDKGVRVDWHGLPGAGQPLDFSAAGQRDIKITVTANTTRVPLYLTDLRLTSPGLPFTVTASFPPVVDLNPRVPRTFPARLTWARQSGGMSLTGSTGSDSGRLVLTGTVGSTFTPQLATAYNDASFSPGVLHGATSASLTATTATTDLFMYLLLIILIVAAVLIALLLRALSRAMLRGTLRLTSVDRLSGEYDLPHKLRTTVPTSSLIGIPGRLTVHGRLFSRDRAMRITLELANRPAGDVELKPGGRAMAAGIDIAHSGRQ
jgi:hypothetical protein